MSTIATQIEQPRNINTAARNSALAVMPDQCLEAAGTGAGFEAKKHGCQLGVPQRTSTTAGHRPRSSIDQAAKSACWRWSHHAQTRLQQRGIPADTADLLLDWGSLEHIGNGRQVVFFRRRDLHHLQRHLPKQDWLELEQRRHLYAVMAANGTVVTVAFRYQHMKRA